MESEIRTSSPWQILQSSTLQHGGEQTARGARLGTDHDGWRVLIHRLSLLVRRLSERELDPWPIALAGKEPPSKAAAITSAGRSI